MPLADIETIVFVMLENRSFDHMLGYLSLDETANGLKVDGLLSDPAWQAGFTNLAAGKQFPLKAISGGQLIKHDPPHGRESINSQIGLPPLGPGPTKMGGFVDTYLRTHPAATDPSVVMGYYDAVDVPTYDFLARNFCVCDRWFTSLPLGTQANRLMAMAGESRVVDNVTILPNQKLVYDWLEERDIPWRVYVSGGYAPFFILMGRWMVKIARSLAFGSGAFRRFSAFAKDWRSVDQLPSVIFIEPQYADAPMSNPNDDHPPAPIAMGQDFVRTIYEVVSSNPDRWQKTLMVVTYDEHGGFFDHVPPPKMQTSIGDVLLSTLGPRVPAILISPHVEAGQVFSEDLDHTSILQLIADRFGDGTYSDAVAKRQSGLGRIQNALSGTARAEKPPRMPARRRAAGPSAFTPSIPTAPDTPNAAAVDTVMRDLARDHPELLEAPGWAEMKAYLESNEPPIPVHKDHIGDASET